MAVVIRVNGKLSWALNMHFAHPTFLASLSHVRNIFRKSRLGASRWVTLAPNWPNIPSESVDVESTRSLAHRLSCAFQTTAPCCVW